MADNFFQRDEGRKSESSQGQRSNNVEQVVIENFLLKGRFRSPASVDKNPEKLHSMFSSVIPSFGDPTLLPLLEKQKVVVESLNGRAPLWVSIIINIAPWLILAAFFVYSSKILRNNIGDPIGASNDYPVGHE